VGGFPRGGSSPLRRIRKSPGDARVFLLANRTHSPLRRRSSGVRARAPRRPHAAGAAALIRDYLSYPSGAPQPDAVYAHMIMSGSKATTTDNTTPAPAASSSRTAALTGAASRRSSTTRRSTSRSPSRRRATSSTPRSWWAELAGTHNDIDLAVIDPSGVVRATSTSGPGVFEKVRVNRPIAAGTWKLRITGYKVSGSQKVYRSMNHTQA
jgi:serine protease AprX